MSDPTPAPSVITEADLTALNQRALLRILDWVRRATVALFAIAGLTALTWLWTALRNQGVIGNADEESFATVFVGEDLDLRERIDIFTSSIFQLALAGALAGIALGVRAYCEVATLSAGGTLTGWNVGDPIDVDADPIELDRHNR